MLFPTLSLPAVDKSIETSSGRRSKLIFVLVMGCRYAWVM